jgi:hypothetical protein
MAESPVRHLGRRSSRRTLALLQRQENILCPLCGECPGTAHYSRMLYGQQVCQACYRAYTFRRAAACLLDLCVGMCLAACAGLLFRIAGDLVPASHRWFHSSGRVSRTIVIVMWLLLKDTRRGLSPGRYLFGQQVVDSVTGQPLSATRCVKRNLALVPLLLCWPFTLAWYLAAFGGTRWGDGWTNSMVSWRKHAHRKPFLPRGPFCPVCAYNLTGNLSRKCPECGTETLEVNSGFRCPEVQTGSERLGSDKKRCQDEQ